MTSPAYFDCPATSWVQPMYRDEAYVSTIRTSVRASVRACEGSRGGDRGRRSRRPHPGHLRLLLHSCHYTGTTTAQVISLRILSLLRVVLVLREQSA